MQESNTVYTPSTRQLVEIGEMLEHRYTLFCGSTRSGKTWATLFSLPLLIETHFKHNCLIAGKTLSSIERNILAPLREIYGSTQVGAIKDKKEVKLFGKIVWIVPFNDNGSVQRIQGISLGLAILDEVVNCPMNYFYMLLTRMDVKGFHVVMTANPSSPQHYIKKWIDDNINVLSLHYSLWKLTDNQFLDASVIESVQNALRNNPTLYKRLVEGMWTATDGLALHSFDRNIHYQSINSIQWGAVLSRATRLTIGIDGANMNDATTCCPLLETIDGTIYVLKNFYHSPKKSAPLSNTQQISLMDKWLYDLWHFQPIDLFQCYRIEKNMVIDCAASDLYIQLEYKFGAEWNVSQFTKKNVKRNLDICNNALSANKIIIVDYEDLGCYDYNEKQYLGTTPLIDELESVPLKESIQDGQVKVGLDPEYPNDALDAFRYGLASILMYENMQED